MRTVKYFARTKEEFNSITEAEAHIKAYTKANGPDLVPGYYMEQYQFRSWVPNWVVRLLTING